MTGPYPPPATTPADDKTTLWAAIGIVLAFCCPLLGALFAALSLAEARKFGNPPTLAYVAFALVALNTAFHAVLVVERM